MIDMQEPIRDAPFRLIQSEARSIVKRSLARRAWLLLSVCFAPGVHAEAPLPSVEVKKFELRVVRKTRSHRTYLFEDASGAQPRSGKVLLLKSGEAPVMAFRVLHVYAEAKRVAARKIQRYGEAADLEDGSSYLALQKLADIYPIPLQSEKEQKIDQAELKELEAAENLPPESGASEIPGEPPPAAAGATAADSADPNATSPTIETPLSEINDTPTAPQTDPPTPEGSAADADPSGAAAASGSDASTESLEGQTPGEGATDPQTPTPEKNHSDAGAASEEAFVDENDDLTLHSTYIKPLDPGRHWITAQWALLRGSTAESGSFYQSGFGIRYGLSLLKRVIFRGANVQDSLTPEVGLFTYKLIDFQGDNNSYSVTPLSLIGRYNLQFGESFGAFLYAGIVKNFVSSSGQSNPDITADLGRVMPAFGVGILAQLGPHWDLRLEGGSDMFGLGLVLRF